MAEKDDDIEILIEADAPVEEKKPEALSAEEGIEKLKAELAAEQTRSAQERTARAEAERRAAQAGSAREAAERSAKDNELAVVTGAIETIQQAQSTAKTAYAAALTAGDFNAAADLQEQISTNAAKLQQLESGKVFLSEEVKNPPPRREEPRITDPVEAMASQLTAPSAAWIRAHPEYARDQALYEKMVRADAAAWGSGIQRDTPEYFEHVEKSLGMRQEARQERRETPPPAAPSGGRQAPGESGKRVVRISPEELEIAEMNGMTPQEYMKEKEALRAEGRLN